MTSDGPKCLPKWPQKCAEKDASTTPKQCQNDAQMTQKWFKSGFRQPHNWPETVNEKNPQNHEKTAPKPCRKIFKVHSVRVQLYPFQSTRTPKQQRNFQDDMLVLSCTHWKIPQNRRRPPPKKKCVDFPAVCFYFQFAAVYTLRFPRLFAFRWCTQLKMQPNCPTE